MKPLDRIVEIFKSFDCEMVILFGSRALGTNTELSDIDIAVKGSNDFDMLFAELKYNEFTLLDIDIINFDDKLSQTLVNDIKQEGIVLYRRANE